MDAILNQAFAGLSLASILLMVALGLAIIYGAMGVINLAHGEFVMLGAYTAWAMNTNFGGNVLLAIPIVFVTIGIVGWLIEKGIVGRLYNRPLDTILATWGIGIVLQQLVRMFIGSDARFVPSPAIFEGNLVIGGVFMSNYRIFVIVFSVAVLLATWYLLTRTEFGTKFRAVIQNREIAECYGIRAERVYSLSFAYGAGLAGVAGVLLAPLVSVTPSMGTQYVVDAFLVVIVGGVGSLAGTAVAAVAVGEGTAFFSMLANDTVGRIAVLLLIVLFIRFWPKGLFPQSVRR